MQDAIGSTGTHPDRNRAIRKWIDADAIERVEL